MGPALAPGCTVYIAGPISDPDPAVVAERLATFDDAAAVLIDRGFAVINPVDVARRWGTDRPHSFYMRHSIRSLAEHASALVFLDGWDQSKGARLEVQVAHAIGIPVVSIDAVAELPALGTGRP
jgi:nucleoside 2-deoxyribosyltransferase